MFRYSDHKPRVARHHGHIKPRDPDVGDVPKTESARHLGLRVPPPRRVGWNSDTAPLDSFVGNHNKRGRDG